MKKRSYEKSGRIEMKIDKGGVSFWQDRLWILDASTFLEDGGIEIDTKAFKVEINDDRNRISLTLKAKP